MIHANSLRVGSKFIGIAGIQTVLSIIDYTNNGAIRYENESHRDMYSHLITCTENRNQYKPCEIEGIELTPQVIEMTGRISRWGGGAYEFGTNDHLLAIQWYDNTQKRVWYSSSGAYVGILHLQYVHELQNLYHGLTGKQLPMREIRNKQTEEQDVEECDATEAK